jgi:hypothetical protein
MLTYAHRQQSKAICATCSDKRFYLLYWFKSTNTEGDLRHADAAISCVLATLHDSVVLLSGGNLVGLGRDIQVKRDLLATNLYLIYH